MSESVASIKAHGDSINSIALSSDVPGLLLTGSEDEHVKIWDIQNNTSFEHIHEKIFKIGGINTMRASPDSGFVFGIGGGNESAPKVWVRFLLIFNLLKSLLNCFLFN